RYVRGKDVSVHQMHKLLLIPIPALTCQLLRDVVAEIKWSSRRNYSTAKEMLKRRSPDLRFLEGLPDNRALFLHDLVGLGLSKQCLSSFGWFAKNGRLKLAAMTPGSRPCKYLLKQDVVAYCQTHYAS